MATELKKALIPLSCMHTLRLGEIEMPEEAEEPIFEITASWIKVFEKSLESLLWSFYAERSLQSDKYAFFVADAGSAGLKSEKVVLVNAPKATELMYCGPVSSEPSLNSKKILELANGLCFYMHPTAAPPAGEIIVPAWLAKPTAKADLATLEPSSLELTIFVTENGEASRTNPHQVCSETDSFAGALVNKHDVMLKKLIYMTEVAKIKASGLKKVKGKFDKMKGVVKGCNTCSHKKKDLKLKQRKSEPLAKAAATAVKEEVKELNEPELSGDADAGVAEVVAEGEVVDALSPTPQGQPLNPSADQAGDVGTVPPVSQEDQEDQEVAETVVDPAPPQTQTPLPPKAGEAEGTDAHDAEAAAVAAKVTKEEPEASDLEKKKAQEQAELQKEKAVEPGVKATQEDQSGSGSDSEVTDCSVDFDHPSGDVESIHIPLPPTLKQWQRKKQGKLSFGPAYVPEIYEMKVTIPTSLENI